MENEVIKQIEKYINILLMPLENHYYHQFGHAIDVKNRAIEIAKKEKLSKEEIEIVTIAALFHDTGFIIQYDDNEYIWAKIAKNYLKSILYPKEKIKIIERLILATKPDYKTPIDILEKVIKDADLDNLGRDDFFEKGHKLKSEVETIKKIKLKNKDWHHASLDLLNNYSYFTKFQKKDREWKKKENAKKLAEMIKDLENKEMI
jgi:uncharacterized protein